VTPYFKPIKTTGKLSLQYLSQNIFQIPVRSIICSPILRVHSYYIPNSCTAFIIDESQISSDKIAVGLYVFLNRNIV
jgi:hypothetical protein